MEDCRRKLVRSWLKWAGHVERMDGERLTKMHSEWRVEVDEEDQD